MTESAIALANDHFSTIYAKSTHGLVRGPSRFPLRAVVDRTCAGKDAGQLLDGEPCGIPIHDSVAHAIESCGDQPPSHCIVGVATVGGVLPPPLYDSLIDAAKAGLTLVNGLHTLLSDDPQLVELTATHGGSILDIRQPPPTKDLHFWSGKILDLEIPRIAVLGTDCAMGKRTTCTMLHKALTASGTRADMIYTGQTGWLQGYPHGLIFDSIPNDFVCGELEHAILECARLRQPEVMLIEGQSGLRNPSGPCGSEFLLSGDVAGVVLLHAPGRACYEGLEEAGCQLPTVASECKLIELYGKEVWAVAVHTENLDESSAEAHRAQLEAELGIPAVLPLRDGVGRIADEIQRRLSLGKSS